jgi:hypothetical protein
MPGDADGELLVASAPTANTLRLRDVRAEPHLGHLMAVCTSCDDDIDLTNCSKPVWHDLQVYS